MIDLDPTPVTRADTGADFLARHPGRFLPSTAGENLDANADLAWKQDFLLSRQIQMSRAWDRYLDEVEKETGKRLANPWEAARNEANRRYTSPATIMAPRTVDFDAIVSGEENRIAGELAALREKFPSMRLRTADDIKGDVAAIVKTARERAAVAGAGADTFGDFAAIAGGMVTVFDPPNLASMFIGAGAGSTLLRQMAVNAGVATLTEGAIQAAAVDPWKRELGIKTSWREAFGNALMAGAGAGALTGVIGGGIRGARYLREQLGPGGEGRAAAIVSDMLDEHAAANPLLPASREGAPRTVPPPVSAEAAPVAPPREPLRPTSKVEAEAAHDTAAVAADRIVRGESADVAADAAAMTNAVRGFEVKGPGLTRLLASDIGADPPRFQFRDATNAAGVSDRLAGVKAWDPILGADAVIVWQDKAGKYWIVDGHHRLDLAKRLMAEGHAPIEMNAVVLREAEGATSARAMFVGALKNISGDRATSIEAAKVLRLIDRDAELARMARDGELPPMPPNSSLYRQAKPLAKLGDEAFALVINEVVPAHYAAWVGRLMAAASDGEQVAALKALARGKPDNELQARVIVEDVKNSGFTQATQTDMFGSILTVESLAPLRAKVLDAALKELKKDRGFFGRLVAEAKRAGDAGNVLDTAANQQRALNDGEILQLVTTLATRSGEISDALSRAARELERGAKLGEAADGFLLAVRNREGRGDAPGANAGSPRPGESGGRAPGDSEGVKPRDESTLDLLDAPPPTPRQIAETIKADAEAKPASATAPSPAFVDARRLVELDGDFFLNVEAKRADGSTEIRASSAKAVLDDAERQKQRAETFKGCVIGLKPSAEGG